MRTTAVRLSMTFPQDFSIRWPPFCSACGRPAPTVAIQATRHGPPLPYCTSCGATHRRWTRWIQSWLGLALVVVLGPVLFIGTTMDRPSPSDSFHISTLFCMDLAFFVCFIAAAAAAIGYVRRSELQGVQIHELRPNESDDPSLPLSAGTNLLEVRFTNQDFYQATVQENQPWS